MKANLPTKEGWYDLTVFGYTQPIRVAVVKCNGHLQVRHPILSPSLKDYKGVQFIGPLDRRDA